MPIASVQPVGNFQVPAPGTTQIVKLIFTESDNNKPFSFTTINLPSFSPQGLVINAQSVQTDFVMLIGGTQSFPVNVIAGTYASFFVPAYQQGIITVTGMAAGDEVIIYAANFPIVPQQYGTTNVTINLDSPPPIGDKTPNTGNFTVLTAGQYNGPIGSTTPDQAAFTTIAVSDQASFPNATESTAPVTLGQANGAYDANGAASAAQKNAENFATAAANNAQTDAENFATIAASNAQNNAEANSTPLIISDAPQQKNQPGMFFGWNITTGLGEGDFVNNNGWGPGGFNFYNQTDNAAYTLIMSIDAAGIISSGGTSAAAFFANHNSSTVEGDIGVYANGHSPAYLYNNAGGWGLYSADGGAVVSFKRGQDITFIGHSSIVLAGASSQFGTYGGLAGFSVASGYNCQVSGPWYFNAPSGQDFVFNQQCVAPNFVLSSDRKFKRNIKPIKTARAAINALQAKTFDKNGKLNSGFIAQDILKIPELRYLVSKRKEGLHVDYIGLIAWIVKRLQEMDA